MIVPASSQPQYDIAAACVCGRLDGESGFSVCWAGENAVPFATIYANGHQASCMDVGQGDFVDTDLGLVAFKPYEYFPHEPIGASRYKPALARSTGAR